MSCKDEGFGQLIDRKCWKEHLGQTETPITAVDAFRDQHFGSPGNIEDPRTILAATAKELGVPSDLPPGTAKAVEVLKTAAGSMEKHEGDFSAAAIGADADSFAQIGKNSPNLLAKEYNRFVYYPQQSWLDAVGKLRQTDRQANIPGDELVEPPMQRLRHQIVVSRGEGEYLKDAGLTDFEARRLYALGRGLQFVDYDPTDPTRFIAGTTEIYMAASTITESPGAAHGQPNKEQSLGAGSGLDLGGAATEALIQSSTKSTWAERQLVLQAGNDLKKFGVSDASSVLSFDEQNKTFAAKEGAPPAVREIVSKLNANIAGLNESKETVDKELDGITSMNRNNDGHDFLALLTKGEFGSSILRTIARTIDGAEDLGTFKTTKLIPFYDRQYEVAKAGADDAPETDPIKRAAQVFTVAYFREQAEKERISAAKLFRDAAFLNLGYAENKLDSDKLGAEVALKDPNGGPHGAQWNLDQADVLEAQLIDRGMSPTSRSADQAGLEKVFDALENRITPKPYEP